MQHPFDVLLPHYTQQIAVMKIDPRRIGELDKICDRLIRDQKIYTELSNRTPNKVPAAFLMAISYREMSGNTYCYLGNGQSLSHVTTIVPKNRGPWLQPYPENFIQGALDALRLDEVDQVSEWSLPRAAYESETLNGWGYLNHGIPSPYVFGGTNIQQNGKYTSDGHLDLTVKDAQLGTLSIIERLFERDDSLRFGDLIIKMNNDPSPAPDIPVGIGGGINVFLLQQRLNVLHVNGTPLRVDGVFGKATTRAVKAFQFTHHLEVDGFVGPKTIKALNM